MMHSFLKRIKKSVMILMSAGLLLTGCGTGGSKEAVVKICDFQGFITTPDEEVTGERMDDLYLYIIGHSEVSQVPEDEVEDMARSVEAYYVQVVERELRQYVAEGHEATFDEMLKFLFGLSSREALTYYAKSYAAAEVSHRMVIRAIADRDGIEVTTDEVLAVESELKGDEAGLISSQKSEIEYEALRRKVLRVTLEKLIKGL